MTEHTMSISNREKMNLTGVKNVVTFDEEQVILETIMGNLYIKGEDLHITNLSLQEGQVGVEGKIDSLDYKEPGIDMKTRSQNVFKRLLK
jgi:sporulation protein YabP